MTLKRKYIISAAIIIAFLLSALTFALFYQRTENKIDIEAYLEEVYGKGNVFKRVSDGKYYYTWWGASGYEREILKYSASVFPLESDINNIYEGDEYKFYAEAYENKQGERLKIWTENNSESRIFKGSYTLEVFVDGKWYSLIPKDYSLQGSSFENIGENIGAGKKEFIGIPTDNRSTYSSFLSAPYYDETTMSVSWHRDAEENSYSLKPGHYRCIHSYETVDGEAILLACEFDIIE